ncbi:MULTISPECIES: MFS transporter [unclassified Nocardioides]|uniref:MFS transporter n=1 Tax=unclassified Nocardioides TaxID=2615069 RepID=UPI0009F06DF6|nr:MULTISPECIES: MFS transporter [unclassified Nocardioides]GAW51829.1 Permease (Proline/betaine) [Nocardioides sp. PD653-B2]GAW53517.1 Permease (Proline/betaine) [Nocardioides sp. PD653]
MSQQQHRQSGPEDHSPSRAPLAAAFASVAGWSFDLFDLFILLYVAGPVGKQIFPAHSQTLSLAAVFASFAVSILMRPAGAAFFGELADRKGRKTIMVTVLAGVGVSTAAMGLVPTYAAIGFLSPIIFLALRIIQGLFVGGVTATTHTLGTESVAPRWRGLMSGLIGGGGAGLGAAMASVVFIVVTSIYSDAAFEAHGWRVMFFSGLLGAVLSLFVLMKVEESPLWHEQQAAAKINPAVVDPQRTRFRDLATGGYRKILIINIAVAAGAGAQYYLTSGFLPTLLGSVIKMPASSRGEVLLVASLVVVVSATLAGELSERIGRRTTMLWIGGANLVLLPVITLVLAKVDPGDTGTVLLFSCLLAFFANAAYAPVMIFLNERYPTALRSRGTAVSWNTGFMLGGLLPTFVNLLSPGLDDVPGRLAVFLVASVLVFLVAVWVSPETRGDIDRKADLAVGLEDEVPKTRLTTPHSSSSEVADNEGTTA